MSILLVSSNENAITARCLNQGYQSNILIEIMVETSTVEHFTMICVENTSEYQFIPVSVCMQDYTVAAFWRVPDSMETLCLLHNKTFQCLNNGNVEFQSIKH